jgi:3-methylcrotonyl-CoA carboxylase beta subunit
MRLPLEKMGAELGLSGQERDRNRSNIERLEGELEDKRAVVRSGWGEKYVDRVHKKGKMTTYERIDALIDPGTDIHPVGSMVNWGRDFQGRQAPGAGVLTAFCRVMERWVMVIANDNTVASGSWWPLTPEKIQRAQEMALKLRIPVIYLVDCSGLYLPEQAKSFPGRIGAGHIFQKNAILSAEGVPQIAGVFGDCIAGGGYMPIISDRVYMTEGAYMVIAGAALIKGAKSLQLTSLDIGGPEVHVHQSGCADIRVPNDEICIQSIRGEIAKLPSSAASFYRHGIEAEDPLHSVSELRELFPPDHRHVYDIRDVIGRLVDGSLFHEFLPETGKEILTGVARVSGLWVGFAANVLEPQLHPSKPGRRPGGILYREGIAKLSAFSRACNDDGIPIVWLQDIAGFDIGVEAESQGLLGYGSSLIYSNSTNTTPMFTILLRKASGAGYYAMAGLPYEPVLQLSTSFARLAVMEGRTLAIAANRTKLDDNYEIISQDPAERARISARMEDTAARIEKDMDPVKAASQMDTDEIICLSELRPWLCALAEMSYQSIGHRRIKNPRIWSIHDLNVLASGPRQSEGIEEKPSEVAQECLEAGESGIFSPMEGSFWSRPSPDQAAFAPEGAKVESGQIIGLVEIMKTFTPIRAERPGVLKGWLVEDGSPIASMQMIGIITD